jgi:CHAD domain-containing protein
MTNQRIEPKAFAKAYRKRASDLRLWTKRYLNAPSSEVTHQLRVALRRYLAAFKILPGSIRRSAEGVSYSRLCEDLLEETSDERDAFTTMSNVARLRKTEVSEPKAIERHSPRALKAASELLSASPAPMHESDLKRGRLSRRLSSQLSNKASRVRSLLPKVRENPSDVAALHELRRCVRSLRYILELYPDESSTLKALGGWQRSLGTIHDKDVAMARLRKSRDAPLIRALTVERSKDYAGFLKASSGGSKLDLFAEPAES